MSYALIIYLNFLCNVNFTGSCHKICHTAPFLTTNSACSSTSMNIIRDEHWKFVIYDMLCLQNIHKYVDFWLAGLPEIYVHYNKKNDRALTRTVSIPLDAKSVEIRTFNSPLW